MDLAWKTVSADQDNEYGQAHVLLRLAIAHDRLGRLAESLELAARALPKWVRLGDVHGEAATLTALAFPTMELGRHDEAIAHFAAALAKYEQIRDPRGQAHALAMLGYLNELHGNLDDALRQHQAVARMSREIGDVRGLAHALEQPRVGAAEAGPAAGRAGELTDAHRHATEIGDQCAAAYALNNVGNVYRLSGKLTEAARYHDRASGVYPPFVIGSSMYWVARPGLVAFFARSARHTLVCVPSAKTSPPFFR